MTGPPLEHIHALFDALLDVPPAQRDAWLDREVPDRADRIALARLLAAESRPGFLDTPAGEHACSFAGNDHDAAAPAGLIGQHVGAFRLTELIGQGGMATVFLGIREGTDFDQRAAVKLLRRGLYSQAEQRLFRRERRALAALSHAHIARLIDGGITAAGIPYLIMEYVDGVPITHYIVAQQLGLRERLQLFTTVCRAVAAAHRALIVHRDLKPSNILVDAAGEPKLLDFGVAKLLDQDDEDGATRTGYSPLTPGYAAPEQYVGGTISTATDVFALGVLLHEILLGERPAPATSQSPSSRVDAIATDLWRLPGSRAVLRAALRGDLDNILLKALSPEPERRYASAAELADDIDRHLQAQPVNAHPPSRWYRTRKFVQRHRGSVLTTTVFALGLIASLGVTLWQADLARREAGRANEQTIRAHAVRDFLVDLFESNDVGLPRDELPTTEQLLAAGGERLGSRTGIAPGVRVQLATLIGRIQRQVGSADAGAALLAKAVDDARREFAPDDPLRLEAIVEQATALAIAHPESARARDLLQQALRDAGPMPDSLVLARLHLTLSQAQHNLDEFAAAAESAERGLAIARRVSDEDNPVIIDALFAIGVAAAQARRNDEAEARLHEAIGLSLRRFGPDHARTLRMQETLASHWVNAGKFAQAEALAQSCLDRFDRIFPAPNATLVNLLMALGVAQLNQGRADEAKVTLERLLGIQREHFPDSPYVATTLHNLGGIAHAQHRIEDALRLFGEAAALHRRNFGPAHSQVAAPLLNQAQMLRKLGRFDEAENAFAQALAINREAFGDEGAPAAMVRAGQAALALDRGDPAGALALVRQALPVLERQLGKTFPRTIDARLTEARALGLLDEPVEAEARLAQLVEDIRTEKPNLKAQLAAALTELGRVHLRRSRPDQALAALTEARSLRAAETNVDASALAQLDALIAQAKR